MKYVIFEKAYKPPRKKITTVPKSSKARKSPTKVTPEKPVAKKRKGRGGRPSINLGASF